MRTFKTFFLSICSILVCFVLANIVIWKCWTEVLLSPEYPGGDLVRLGYIGGIKQVRNNTTSLPRTHIEMKDYQGERVDMITIGDSFSIGGGDGLNKYYQDYIASISKIKVLNIPTYKFETMVCGAMPVTTLSALYHSGLLDKIKPRYVLLQTVERYAIPRLTTYFSFDTAKSANDLNQFYKATPANRAINKGITFINIGNLKFLYYSFMFNFSEHAFRRIVVKKKMDRPLFSGAHNNLLLFHGDDVLQAPLTTPQSVKVANDNLNQIARLLRKKDIQLVFMPVVDKLNLYRPYFQDDKYPKSVFFEELRKLPKAYRLIDTKAILGNAVQNGEQDIFHQDDTHWTWKASELIFKSERFTPPTSSRY